MLYGLNLKFGTTLNLRNNFHVMKKVRIIRNLAASFAAAAVISGPSAFAQNLTWNGTATGNNTWSTSAQNWFNGTTNIGWPTTDPTAVSANATFGGVDGDYTINLAQNISITSLIFNNDGYKLDSASPLTIGFYRIGSVADITVASGKTAQIGSNITVSRLVGSPPTGQSAAMNLRGGGTLNLNGSLIQNNTNNFTMFNGSRLIVGSTGNASFGSSVVVGSDATSGALLQVDGGTVLMPVNSAGNGNLILANVAGTTTSANITITGGSILMTGSQSGIGVRFGSTTGNASTNVTGIINLDGGVFQTNRFFEGSATGTINSTVNFNGGILKIGNSPNATFLSVDNTIVKAGGVRINTDSSANNDGSGAKTLTLNNSFNTDLVSTGGGFEKLGAGNLTLTGSSNYTGATVVTAGSLIIGSGGSIGSTANITVATGATFTNNSGGTITEAFVLSENATLNGGNGYVSLDTEFVADLTGGLLAAASINSFTKDGELNFSLSNVQAGSWTIFTGTGIGGSFDTVAVGATSLSGTVGGIWTGNDGVWIYTYNDGNGSNLLTISAIPEPGTALLLGVGLAGLAVLRRRRMSA